jgi:hypothetical protein
MLAQFISGTAVGDMPLAGSIFPKAEAQPP